MKANRIFRILKWTAGIIISLVVLVAVATLLANSNYVQQQLLKKATSYLSERLGTSVKADSVSVNLFVPSMSLYGLDIEDQQKRPMLRMGEASARITIASIWEKSITIEHIEADRLEAMIIKDSLDSAPNYQFLVDSLSKKKDVNKEKESNGKTKLNIDMREVTLNNARFSFQQGNKKNEISLVMLDVNAKGEGYDVKLDSLRLKTNNHMPRKNTNRPNRGWFDAGHLDITASLECSIHTAKKDTLSLTLDNATISDRIIGIDIKDMHLKATSDMKTMWLKDIALKQGSTSLNISSAAITLPNKKTGRKLAYKTGVITGNVILRDIARPFAPVLKGFQLPLRLKVQMSGNEDMMRFTNVRVSTTDNHLTIAANGYINNLRVKHGYKVSFDVNNMKIKQGTAERVINQFPVKRLMMSQLQKLGDITYNGHFDAVWRNETFMGHLATACGPFDFHFSIDDNNKWLKGGISTTAFRLGTAFEIADLGNVACHADFNVDISKERTALARKDKGGKLPIGSVSATVDDSSYKKLHVRNVDATIDCDGSIAEGDITQRGKHRDIYCHFTYNPNLSKSKLKLSKPGISFHKKDKSNDEQMTDSVGQKKKKGLLRGLFKKKSKE